MTVRMDPRRLMYLPPPSSEVVTVAKTTGTDGDGAYCKRTSPPATPGGARLGTDARLRLPRAEPMARLATQGGQASAGEASGLRMHRFGHAGA